MDTEDVEAALADLKAQSRVVAVAKKPNAVKRRRKASTLAGGDGDAAPAPTSNEEKMQVYEADHLGAYAHESLAWPPELLVALEEKATTLSTREKELLYLEECVSGSARAITTLMARDLNLSIKWGRWCANYVSCITCSSQFWVRGTTKQGHGHIVDRPLLGTEALALQGFTRDVQTEFVRSLDMKLQVRLAGNAFTAETFARTLLAAVMELRLDEATTRIAAHDGQSSVGDCSEGEAEEEEEEDEEQDLEPDGMEVEDEDLDSILFDD